MDAVRYEITYMSPQQKGMQRLPVPKNSDHSDAAQRAVRLATDGGAWNVIVGRFDPATGWDLVGFVRRFTSTLPGSDAVIYHDARTGPQQWADAARYGARAGARALDEAATPPHTRTEVEPPRGHRSGMRVWGAARALHADRSEQPV